MALGAIAGISFAASVIQLVDFSAKLLSRTNEFYRDAAGGEINLSDLRSASQNLANLTLALSVEAPPKKEKRSRGLKELYQTVEEAQTIAKELHKITDRLRTNTEGRKWKSFRAAINAFMNDDQVEELQRRLNRVREKIIFSLIVVARYVARTCERWNWITNFVKGRTFEIDVSTAGQSRKVKGRYSWLHRPLP
jgi:hypothetical protein